MTDNFVSEAIIRNPIEHLVVACLTAGVPVGTFMSDVWNNCANEHSMCKAQWRGLPTDGDLRLWDYARVFTKEGYNYPAPDVPDVDPLMMDEIMDHFMFDDLMESDDHYGPDFQLWLRALRTDKEGVEK